MGDVSLDLEMNGCVLSFSGFFRDRVVGSCSFCLFHTPKVGVGESSALLLPCAICLGKQCAGAPVTLSS